VHPNNLSRAPGQADKETALLLGIAQLAVAREHLSRTLPQTGCTLKHSKANASKRGGTATHRTLLPNLST